MTNRNLFPRLAHAAGFLTVLWISAIAHSQEAEKKPRPNVVLIVIDDLGWADLGCYGSTFHKTPQLDKLAKQGMRFTDAYAACPVCTPTRAAIMTGKYPARLNITDWLPGRGDMPSQKLLRPKIEQQLPLAEVTIAERLREAGYRTASIGKWHLGGAGFGPETQGFEVNIGGDQGGSPPGYFAPFVRENAKGKAAGRNLKGLEAAPDGGYLTDLLTDAAVNFIEKNRAEPFFLYLPHYAVHTPLQAKEEVIKKYPADPKFSGKQNSSVYAAMLESVDDGVGRIMAKLDELKLTENTLVIFTSDNGGLATPEGPHTPATSNAPLREGKGYLYEGGIRVPLIMHWPKNIRTGINGTLTSSVDLLPTLLDVCSLSATTEVDGVSIRAAMQEEERPVTRDLFWHYPHYANQGGKPSSAIRSGRWKLIEFFEDGHRELFDLTSDMRENRNLVTQHPQVVAELAEKLEAWRKNVGAKMMEPNPDYKPNPQAADGIVTMPAKWATVYGETLRYEPLPHKNTLGFWTNPKEWASFEFTLETPGTYEVELLVGCGNGSGGSEVQVVVDEQKLNFTVEQTGGFQNFVPRKIGQIKLDKPGRYTVEIRPQTKPGPAVMDVREVKLLPVK
ncbi:sulfatase-like hydrolase/transferase [Anatilimnocola floriformis]|uniref:sulfatase-like hydrolase/transferase n=1 Tax=Anatilimnocola floriformis TaxID=2948575 RepID=UPI0020C459CF|nr:sulfatase-like hydrolase/transferase [Anatilimnocola floriformis]